MMFFLFSFFVSNFFSVDCSANDFLFTGGLYYSSLTMTPDGSTNPASDYAGPAYNLEARLKFGNKLKASFETSSFSFGTDVGFNFFAGRKTTFLKNRSNSSESLNGGRWYFGFDYDHGPVFVGVDYGWSDSDISSSAITTKLNLKYSGVSLRGGLLMNLNENTGLRVWGAYSPTYALRSKNPSASYTYSQKEVSGGIQFEYKVISDAMF